MKHRTLTAWRCLQPLGAAVSSSAATYAVGPAAGQLLKLADVPWGGLQSGDVANIHVQPGGYREIIQVSASGTAANPILIGGIPNANGALPVIDGLNLLSSPCSRPPSAITRVFACGGGSAHAQAIIPS